VESGIESAVKKISPRGTLKLELTPDICRQLGFVEITGAQRTVEQERDLGQPFMMFGVGQRGVKIFSFTIRPPQNGDYPWMLTQAEEGSRSTTSSNFNSANKGSWTQRFTFEKQSLKITALPLTDKRRVKYTLQAEP
jgi:hypothetical protein